MPRTMVYGRGGRTGPKPLEAAFQGLASGLAGAAKGYTDIQKGRMNQLTAAFPSLVAAGMMRQSPTGDIRFGGQRWNIQQPTPDYTKMLAGVRYGQALGTVPPSPSDIVGMAQKGVSQLWRDQNWQIEALKQARQSDDPNFMRNLYNQHLQANIQAVTDYFDALAGQKPETKADMPKQKRDRAIEALKKHNLPVTEKNIKWVLTIPEAEW